MVGNELVLKKLLSRTHRGWGGKGVAAIRFVTSLALKGIEFVTKKRSERVVIESGAKHGGERGDLEIKNVKKCQVYISLPPFVLLGGATLKTGQYFSKNKNDIHK